MFSSHADQVCSLVIFRSVAPQKKQAGFGGDSTRSTLTPMADEKREPTQQTQPKKGKPVEIPVPKRSDFDRLLAKAEKPPKK